MIIRAYELKRGDIFMKQGITYCVAGITEKSIIYCGAYCVDENTYSGTYNEMGKRSQERVEYLGVRKSKKKTKPIKEYI